MTNGRDTKARGEIEIAIAVDIEHIRAPGFAPQQGIGIAVERIDPRGFAAPQTPAEAASDGARWWFENPRKKVTTQQPDPVLSRGAFGNGSRHGKT